ncbi:MAG: hypothetical protein H7258_07970 [Ferruginibacter sp.]|nr:hypothetical protein [Ferruginibacter sp.]
MRFVPIILLLLLVSAFNTAASQNSAILPASNKYSTSWALRKCFMGENYRQTWQLSVKMAIFDITKEKGGLTIKKLGGGAETKSLRLVGKDGIEWVLRTVDKDVGGVMNRKFRKTFIKDIVQDMISTAYPYAPLTIGPMAKALGLNAPQPSLFYVPDDTAFGKYQAVFAHKVCMFEQYAPTRGSNTETLDTDSLLRNIYKHTYDSVDDTAYLKARLLDMLIADWDRHEEQYRWELAKNGTENVYYPILRDRDQAFFYSDGLVLVITRLFALRFMKNFTKRVNKLTQLSKRSWKLDRMLLSQLDENDWRRVINDFQLLLNDSVLDNAVRNIPEEAHHQDGNRILETLKARRNKLMKQGMKYYKFLAKKVIINCNARPEKIKIINDGNNLIITVIDKETLQLKYKRIFNPVQTKEIWLSTPGVNDEVDIAENCIPKIKLRLDSGRDVTNNKKHRPQNITAEPKTF